MGIVSAARHDHPPAAALRDSRAWRTGQRHWSVHGYSNLTTNKLVSERFREHGDARVKLTTEDELTALGCQLMVGVSVESFSYSIGVFFLKLVRKTAPVCNTVLYFGCDVELPAEFGSTSDEGSTPRATEARNMMRVNAYLVGLQTRSEKVADVLVKGNELHVQFEMHTFVVNGGTAEMGNDWWVEEMIPDGRRLGCDFHRTVGYTARPTD